jgi:4'-phosphopantetheinyl transferase
VLKQAYIRACGQPLGFDWSRLEFDVPARRAAADRAPLAGWEFRLFAAHVGRWAAPPGAPPPRGAAPEAASSGAGGARVDEDEYVACVAFFRGAGREPAFHIYDGREALDSWVQFINVDQMLKVVPKLLA